MSELREVWAVYREYGQEAFIVAIYPGKREAEQHAEMAKKEVPEKPPKGGWRKFRNPYDPEFVAHPWLMSRVSYYVDKHPFALHVDQFLERVPE
jgi:hypothetical protein